MPLRPTPSGLSPDPGCCSDASMATILAEPAGDVMRFWESCRLKADDRYSIPQPNSFFPHDRPYLEVLSEVLVVGYGLRAGVVVNKGKEVIKARTSPSAGALYPFEVLVQVGRLGETYLYDVEGARFRPFSPVIGDLRAPGDTDSEGDASNWIGQVLFVARPWLSMKKYGQRGYLYTQLDIGHAAVSVALSAQALGLRATVRLRIQRQRLAEKLGLSGLCREPQVAVTIGLPQGGRDAGMTAATTSPPRSSRKPTAVGSLAGAERATLEAPTLEEEGNWRSLLEEVGPVVLVAPPPAHRANISSILEPEECESRGASVVPCHMTPTLTRDHRAAVFRRESAKGFLPLPLTLTQLIGALFEGGGMLHADCGGPGAAGVGFRMMVRRVEGLEAGIYAYSAREQLLLEIRRGRAVRGEEEVLLACMGQPVVRHAAAIVTLYAPLRALLKEIGRAGLSEVHFHAAHVAHKLCLAAARHGVGITCIGGFDERRSADLVDLGLSEEVIYVLALGIADQAARKSDRDAVAHGHEPGGGGS